MDNKISYKIEALIEALKNSSDLAYLVEDVEGVLQQCNNYVSLVSNEEASIQMARAFMDGPEYRVYVQNIDRSRRIHHDALVVSMNMLNRVAKMVKVRRPFDVDHDDRESYYKVAKLVVDAYYTTGAAGTATASVKVH